MNENPGLPITFVDGTRLSPEENSAIIEKMRRTRTISNTVGLIFLLGYAAYLEYDERVSVTRQQAQSVFQTTANR